MWLLPTGEEYSDRNIFCKKIFSKPLKPFSQIEQLQNPSCNHIHSQHRPSSGRKTPYDPNQVSMA